MILTKLADGRLIRLKREHLFCIRNKISENVTHNIGKERHLSLSLVIHLNSIMRNNDDDGK